MQESHKIRPALVVGVGALALAVSFGVGFAVNRPAKTGAASTPPASSVSALASAPLSPEVNARFLIPVSESQPQRGPLEALVTVVEWCDLRGDPCRDADKALSQLMTKYAGRLRWVHRHHIDLQNFDGSQRLHAFARGAFQYSDPDNQEKFWLVREKLLALPGDAIPSEAELRRIAGEVGVDFDAIAKGIDAHAYAGGLAIDTKFEPRFGITTAPVFFVNGRRVPLSPKVDMKRSIDTLIQQEMVIAKRLVDGGLKGEAVYEEITKDGLWALNDDPSKRAPARAAAPSALSIPRSN